MRSQPTSSTVLNLLATAAATAPQIARGASLLLNMAPIKATTRQLDEWLLKTIV